MKITEKDWERFRILDKDSYNWPDYKSLNPEYDTWEKLLKVNEEIRFYRVMYEIGAKQLNEFIFILKTEKLLNE